MRVTWTKDMIAALREMRAKAIPLYECAERIGVGYPAAVYKARELGIAQRMNRGRLPGYSAWLARRAAAAIAAITIATSAQAQTHAWTVYLENDQSCLPLRQATAVLGYPGITTPGQLERYLRRTQQGPNTQVMRDGSGQVFMVTMTSAESPNAVVNIFPDPQHCQLARAYVHGLPEELN